MVPASTRRSRLNLPTWNSGARDQMPMDHGTPIPLLATVVARVAVYLINRFADRAAGGRPWTDERLFAEPLPRLRRELEPVGFEVTSRPHPGELPRANPRLLLPRPG